jgi:hypothetical protein
MITRKVGGTKKTEKPHGLERTDAEILGLVFDQARISCIIPNPPNYHTMQKHTHNFNDFA